MLRLPGKKSVDTEDGLISNHVSPSIFRFKEPKRDSTKTNEVTLLTKISLVLITIITIGSFMLYISGAPSQEGSVTLLLGDKMRSSPASGDPIMGARHLNGTRIETTNNDPPLNVDYMLASKQSFGFFDNYPDADWKRAQEIHAKMFPNHYTNDLRKYSNGPDDKGNFGKLKKSSYWNGENFQIEFHCPLAQRVPSDSQADGPKWICDPHRIKKRDCLIYSFGSNGKAEFEQGVKDHVGDHCEIHTFDMITSNRRNGDFATALRGLSTFHSWGLGTEAQAKNDPRRFKTLEQTMQELGHVGRTIDIFKIDCEWCEWFTYKQWLKQDIRQILVETHNAPMPQARDFFYNLHDSGFVIFSKEANYQNGAGGVEFGFLKLSTDFFMNKYQYNNSALIS